MAEQKRKKSPWAKFGKALHIAVVVAFFLPFFGVSCKDKDAPGGNNEMDIITISTADMTFGCAPGGLISEAQDNKDMKDLGGEIKIDKVKVEPLAILAMLAAVAGVVLSFLFKGSKAVKASLISSVVCLGAVIGIWLKVGGEIDSTITDKMKADMEKSSMTRGSEISSGPRMGLWISLACLAACAALAGLSLKHREDEMPDIVTPPGGLPPNVSV